MCWGGGVDRLMVLSLSGIFQITYEISLILTFLVTRGILLIFLVESEGQGVACAELGRSEYWPNSHPEYSSSSLW